MTEVIFLSLFFLLPSILALFLWGKGKKQMAHTGMKKEDFYIGLIFWTATGAWRCTDVGTRVIVAVKMEGDPRDYTNGPPYSVVEHSFDEYDFGGCSLEEFE